MGLGLRIDQVVYSHALDRLVLVNNADALPPGPGNIE